MDTETRGLTSSAKVTLPRGLSTFGLVTRMEDGGVSREAAVEEVDEEDSLFSSVLGVL